MIRALFTLASGVSLLLLGMLYLLWFGHRGSMQCVLPTALGFRSAVAYVDDGRLGAALLAFEYAKRDKGNQSAGRAGLSYYPWPWRVECDAHLQPARGHTFVWLSNDVWADPTATETYSGFLIPAWPVALALGMLPLSWIAVTARRSRRRRGGCKRCGYDLTGNMSGVCPECGTSLASVR